MNFCSAVFFFFILYYFKIFCLFLSIATPNKILLMLILFINLFLLSPKCFFCLSFCFVFSITSANLPFPYTFVALVLSFLGLCFQELTKEWKNEKMKKDDVFIFVFVSSYFVFVFCLFVFFLVFYPRVWVWVGKTYSQGINSLLKNHKN